LNEKRKNGKQDKAKGKKSQEKIESHVGMLFRRAASLHRLNAEYPKRRYNRKDKPNTINHQSSTINHQPSINTPYSSASRIL